MGNNLMQIDAFWMGREKNKPKSDVPIPMESVKFVL